MRYIFVTSIRHNKTKTNKMTKITEISISGSTVWMTYNKRGLIYEGFTPYKTVQDAINYANEVLGYWAGNSDFVCTAKTFKIN